MKGISNILESASFRTLITFLLSSIWIVLYLQHYLGYNHTFGFITIVMLMISSGLLVVRSFVAKNSLFFVLFSFIFLYTIPAKLVFFNNIYISAHHRVFSYDTLMLTSLIFLLFTIVLNAFIKIPKKCNILKLDIVKNSFIFWVLVIISIILVVIGKSGNNILISGGYGQGQVNSSSINEYLLIFFLLIYIYHGNNKIKLYVLYTLISVYSIKNLLYGGRIEVAMLLLMFFTIRFQYKISFLKTFILFLIGVWIFSLFSTIRSNPQQLFTNEWYTILNPFTKNENTLDYVGTNAGDVFWGSERILLLIKDNYLTNEKRIIAGLSYLISPFMPTAKLTPLANLTNFRTDIYSTGGGGLAPIYFYTFLSFPGVILFGIFISKCFNGIVRRSSMTLHVYIILLITTLPRWFAYNPIQIVKLCVWGVLIFIFFKSLNYSIKKYF